MATGCFSQRTLRRKLRKCIYLLEVLNDMPRLKAALVLLSLATASVPATVSAQQSAQNTYGAVPGFTAGSLQFVQGQANIDGQPINGNDTNNNINQPRQLRAGETLATANGTADILLAPGALLRIGQDSTVRMVAEDQGRTEVKLEQGRANISVNVVRHDDLLLLDLQNGQTQILSRGLYTFNTATNTVRVFNGEAEVFPGTDTTSNVKPVKVKESHELILGGDRAKPASFDREMADADLLPWTGPKETRAALADNSIARQGGANYGYAGYYPGAYGFYGDGLYAAGYDYPYAWGPYGFWGYPFFGVGFGYWGGGFYGGGYPLRGRIGPIRGGYGGYGGYAGRGYAGRGAIGGFGGGHAFAGGGGFGGFHGGGGRR